MPDAVVLAAGLGSRLRPLTDRWPKPVLPIDGRPVIVTLVHELAAAGICAADTKFADGDLDRFVAAAGGDGSIAVRRQPGRPDYTRTRVEDGRVARVVDRDGGGDWTGAPLWFVGEPVLEALHGELGGPPYELAEAFQRAIDAGAIVSAIPVGRTRDLTAPADLVTENVPYLR